jgi:hypothetical protein
LKKRNKGIIDTTRIDTITVDKDVKMACYFPDTHNINFCIKRKSENDNISLRKKYNTKECLTIPFMGYLFNELEHEMLHKTIRGIFFGKKGAIISHKLDNTIQGKNLEWERLKRFAI